VPSSRRAAVAVGVAAAAIAIWLWLRPRPVLPPQQAIEALLDDAAEAARKGRVKDVMAHVSDRYRGDSEGASSKGELRPYLAVLIARGAEVRFLSRDVVVEGERARVRATVVFVGGGLRNVLSGDAGAREVELDLELEEDEWKVVASRHAPVSVDLDP
jgi:hypothetical protein